MDHHDFFGLLGKGLFASVAIMLMLGGDQHANAVPDQRVSMDGGVHRSVQAQPAALPAVKAIGEQQSTTVVTSQPRWVF